MPSRLYSHIYPWLQSAPVELNGSIVACRGLNDQTLVVESDLPLRVLLHLGAKNSGTVARVGVGNVFRNAHWIVTERLLLSTVQTGREVQAYSGWLIEYIVALEDALRQMGPIWTPDMAWRIEDELKFDLGEYEYPSGSSNYYFGVSTEIPVHETF